MITHNVFKSTRTNTLVLEAALDARMELEATALVGVSDEEIFDQLAAKIADSIKADRDVIIAAIGEARASK